MILHVRAEPLPAGSQQPCHARAGCKTPAAYQVTLGAGLTVFTCRRHLRDSMAGLLDAALPGGAA